MMVFKCRTDTKSIDGYRFTRCSVWRVLVNPGPSDNMAVLSRAEGQTVRQEIISRDKLRKCFRRVI